MQRSRRQYTVRVIDWPSGNVVHTARQDYQIRTRRPRGRYILPCDRVGTAVAAPRLCVPKQDRMVPLNTTGFAEPESRAPTIYFSPNGFPSMS